MSFHPQAQSVPSFLIATACKRPAETDRQLASVPICAGSLLSLVVPIPSWPYLFDPQAHSVPSFLIARV